MKNKPRYFDELGAMLVALTIMLTVITLPIPILWYAYTAPRPEVSTSQI